MLIPKRLKPGDTVGLVSPSRISTPENCAEMIAALKEMGFRVKSGKNLYADSWGYAASDQERADDIHQLVCDDEVAMLCFTGGEGADEVIPLLDYDTIARHPKIFMSFSDATSILNAIHSRTGLVTYYGLTPGCMVGITDYNRRQFVSHIMEGGVRAHVRSGDWRTLIPGVASGELTGGYLDNYVFLANSGWVRPEPGKQYILFIEEHEMFFPIEHVSDELSRLEQSPLMKQVSGLLFGHYSDPVCKPLLERLTRLGQRHGIPVAYCDDFGHGENRAILPIGVSAMLDTEKQTLTYPENEQ